MSFLHKADSSTHSCVHCPTCLSSHSYASNFVHTTKFVFGHKFYEQYFDLDNTFSVSTLYAWAKERNFPHLIWRKSIKCTNVQSLRQRQQHRHQKLASRRATLIVHHRPLSCLDMSWVIQGHLKHPPLGQQRQPNDHRTIAITILFWSCSVGCTMAGIIGIEAASTYYDSRATKRFHKNGQNGLQNFESSIDQSHINYFIYSSLSSITLTHTY